MTHLELTVDEKHIMDSAAIEIIQTPWEHDLAEIDMAMEYLTQRHQEVIRQKVIHDAATTGFWFTVPLCALVAYVLLHLLGVL